MAVKQTMTVHEMANDLLTDEYADWTRAGAYGLAEYLDELSDDIGEDIEWNRIDIRCEWSEYTWESAEEAYSIEFGFDAAGINPTKDDLLEAFRDSTAVAYYDDDVIIIADF